MKYFNINTNVNSNNNNNNNNNNSNNNNVNNCFKKIGDNLVELVNQLNKKEKYRYHDRDDLDYHRVR